MNHNFSANNNLILLMPMNFDTSEQYRLLRNRKDNMLNFFSQKEISKEQQTIWFNNYLNDNKQAMFSIFDLKSNDFIGGIGFYDLDVYNKSVEIGRIIIDKQKASGKGFAVLAINEVVNIIINNFKINNIFAYIYKNNIASLKSFKKAGFVKDIDYENETIEKVILLVNLP